MNLRCHDDIVFLLSRVMKVQITKTLILLAKDKIANINSPQRLTGSKELLNNDGMKVDNNQLAHQEKQLLQKRD